MIFIIDNDNDYLSIVPYKNQLINDRSSSFNYIETRQKYYPLVTPESLAAFITAFATASTTLVSKGDGTI